MWNTYINVNDLDQAFELLEDKINHYRIIAGGTDLVLELEKNSSSDQNIIDISRVKGLDTISLETDGTIHIGPLVTHNQCISSKLLHEYALPLVMASLTVGSPQIRNRGTIAGNLITASPANDTISPLMALNAILTLQSKRGKREVQLKEFYTGVRKSVIQPDEILVDIAFRKMEENQFGVFKKFALRKAQAISLVNATCILTLERKMITDAVITLGSVAPTIIHATQAERFLLNKELNENTIEEAASLAAQEVKPIDDIRGSAKYRQEMTRVMVKRALLEIQAGKVEQSVPEHPVLLWGKTKNNYPEYTIENKRFDCDSAIETAINSKKVTVKNGAQKSLLRFIREDIGLTGTKEGCAEGECGACTVLLDGVAVMSCLVPAPRAEGAEITTIEGMKQGEKLAPIQQAFIEEGAVQCGYCTPGFIMSANQLIEEKRDPQIDDINMAISGNLCRCTGYYKIVKAIETAITKA